MLIGRILLAISLVLTLAVTAIGIWRGDTWNIVIGALLTCCTTSGAVIALRARR